MFKQRNKFHWKRQLTMLLVFVLVASSFPVAFASPVSAAEGKPNSPGGVSNNIALWLKADEGVTVQSDGSALNGWIDQTGTNKFTVTGAPVKKENAVNFNPVVNFTNKGNAILPEHRLTGDQMITYKDGYAVFKMTKSPGGTVIGSVEKMSNYGSAVFSHEGAELYVGNGANSTYHTFSFNDFSSYHLAEFDVSRIDKTLPVGRLDGGDQKLTRKPEYTSFAFTPMIGGSNGGGSASNYNNLNGEIAEVILYSDSTHIDRAKIETYLAVKYGITLNNGKSNYLHTGGESVWTADSAYENNIAGIGRDDIESLLQKQSRSSNTGTQIAIGLGERELAETNADNKGTFTDRQYLIWGDNGKGLTFSQQIGTTNKNHTERVWKVQNTGEVGEVLIAIPQNAIPKDAVLLVGSSDTDFTNPVVNNPLTEVVFEGKTYYTTQAMLADGQYFTFAAPAPTPESATLEQTQTNGNQITLTFDQEVELTDLTGFTIKVGNDVVTIGTGGFKVDPTDAKKLILTLPTGTDVTGKTVNVSYDRSGNLKGKNGVVVNSFNEELKPVPTVDKSKLQDKFDVINAENLKAEDFTPDSWKALQDQLTASEIVLNDPDATQADVNEALTALTQARKDLKEVPTTVNKTELQEAFDTIKAENLKAEDFTPDSWKALQDQLTASEIVLNDPDATQADVNEALTALTQARKDLKEVPTTTVDKTALQAKVDVSKNYNPANYTSDSWQALQKALDNARIVLADDNATPEQVKQAYDTLVSAYDGLRTIPSTGGDNGNSGSGSGSSAGGSSSSSTPSPSTPPAVKLDMSTNGDKTSFATGTEKKNGTQTETTVQINTSQLATILSKGNEQKLSLHVPNNGNVQTKGLTAAAVKQLADAKSSLEISNLLAIYPLPSNLLDLGAIAKQLNNTQLDKIAVNVGIQRSADAVIDRARNKATKDRYELLVDPVDLNLTFTHEGQSIQAGQLNRYAPKYIALPEGIDPNRITTGVIVNEDGSVFHVPTVVTKINNRYFALINDLRSSGSYSVIWNPKDFNDVKNHWAQSKINNIAARLILAGKGNNAWSPDLNVDRAEFATMVVTGLGLMSQDVQQKVFKDVSTTAWYHNSVVIANDYQIVLGYDDGTFRGSQQITREQGIAMIARAYNMIKPQTTGMDQSQINNLLGAFNDKDQVTNWAKEPIAQLVAAGVVDGQSLRPQEFMTRAESADIIETLLKKTQLID
jgi:hypothetical protein